jgi:hypothetical protein
VRHGRSARLGCEPWMDAPATVTAVVIGAAVALIGVCLAWSAWRAGQPHWRGKVAALIVALRIVTAACFFVAA